MKEVFKNVRWMALLKLSVLYAMATVMCELGLACYYTAALGTDPISIFVEGVSLHTSLSLGQISSIGNLILGILFVIFDRKKMGPGTFITIAMVGPILDFFHGILVDLFPVETTAIWIRVIILTAGIVLYAAGLGIAIGCDLGVGPFSFPPIFLARVLRVDLKYTQIATDAMFFVAGVLLGGVVGLGSIVSVLATGPLMEWSLKRIGPLVSRIGPYYRKEAADEHH